MIQRILIASILAVAIATFVPFELAFAQFQSGGVDHDGDWFVGEGLKQGDYFAYKLCHVDYKECADIRMELWIEGDTVVGTENPWLAQTVVYDGNKVLTGTITLGKIAPEPTGGSAELTTYRSVFKNSVVWLSAFATSYAGEGGEGPKRFDAPSWGKIGNIGGEQVIPTAIESVTTPAGTFEETILVSWKTGGYRSNVWVVDEFPFPVKAKTVTHVSEGIPPTEYEFTLLDYKENVSENPFADIVPTDVIQKAKGCPEFYDDKKVTQTTKDFKYMIKLFYGPPNPISGCEIEFKINFHSKFDETEFLNQVQYDILVVDDDLTPLRSLAQEEGRLFLYSPSGQARVFVPVTEPAGIANYVIWVYGLSHENIAPSPDGVDYLLIEIPIDPSPTTTPITPTPTEPQIPDWIKNNAGWWADDQIDDVSFVGGIQYLIKEGIMTIPETQQGTGTGTSDIPDWIKTNAGWWATNQIDDVSFVGGIQWLIENGVIVLG